jgi:hypothetical protein
MSSNNLNDNTKSSTYQLNNSNTNLYNRGSSNQQSIIIDDTEAERILARANKINEQSKTPSAPSPCCRACYVSGCSFLAILFAVLGFMMVIWLPDFVQNKMNEELSLKNPRTILYEGFRNQSEKVQVRFVYNFFNVTNERIKWRPESDVYWDADGVLHYKTLDYFNFLPDKSAPGASENDWVVSPRAAIFIAIQRTGGEPEVMEIINDYLSDFAKLNSTFINRTIGQLFHGYNDSLLEPFAFLGIDPLVAFGPDIPTLQEATWSAIYSGGPASPTIDTEESRRKKDRTLGQYYEWFGFERLPYWASEWANMLNGSDGSMFPQNLFDVKYQYIWVDNLKRSVLAEHKTNVDYHGIDLQRYTLADGALNASWEFYQNPNGMDGLIPIPPVKNHNYDYILSVLGMPFYLDTDMRDVHVNLPRQAVYDLDSSHLDIEPNSGILMRVRNQLMASLRLRQIQYFKPNTTETVTLNLTKNLPNTWIPVFTASEEYEMGQDLRDRIKLEILLPKRLAKFCGPSFIAISILIAGFMVIREFLCTKKQIKNEEEE